MCLLELQLLPARPQFPRNSRLRRSLAVDLVGNSVPMQLADIFPTTFNHVATMFSLAVDSKTAACFAILASISAACTGIDYYYCIDINKNCYLETPAGSANRKGLAKPSSDRQASDDMNLVNRLRCPARARPSCLPRQGKYRIRNREQPVPQD